MTGVREWLCHRAGIRPSGPEWLNPEVLREREGKPAEQPDRRLISACPRGMNLAPGEGPHGGPDLPVREIQRRTYEPVYVRIGHRGPPGQGRRPDLRCDPGRDPRQRSAGARRL